MQTGQVALLQLLVPFALVELVLIFNGHSVPVAPVAGLCVRRLAEVLEIVQILLDHQVLPSLSLAKVFEFLLRHTDRAAKKHVVLKGEHGVIQVKFVLKGLDFDGRRRELGWRYFIDRLL